jgi:hypothetical protein
MLREVTERVKFSEMAEKESAMRVRNLIVLALSLVATGLSGCGGGGGGGGGVPTTTVIGGMASKGPIKAGTVKVFAIKDGKEDRSASLAQGQTDSNGNYSIDLGAYKGAVVVEVSSGSYTDEVLTSTTVSLKAPLRAVFANASSGRRTVAITPLTEMAYKKAVGGGTLTAATINDANARIASLFQLSDIVATLPVTGATAGEQEKKYAFACGSFSQLVNNSKNVGESLDDALQRVMTSIGNELEKSGGLSNETIASISSAIADFDKGGKNQTGATITLATPTSGVLKLSTAGTADAIGGIDLTIGFPAGVVVDADGTGEPASGVVTVSGVAAVGDNTLTAAKFTPASGGNPAQLHIALVNATGFGLGEFVTVKFKLAAGGALPAGKDAFTVTGFAAKGLSSATTLAGITAAPSSVGGL